MILLDDRTNPLGPVTYAAVSPPCDGADEAAEGLS